MYKGEYGKGIYVNCDTDISLASTTDILITKPDGTEVTVQGTVGTTDVLADCNVTFNAYEYMYYVTVDGDIDQSGTYYFRSIVDISGVHYIGSIDSFEVFK